MKSELIRGVSYKTLRGQLVRCDYAYIAQRSTIFDEELIAWANRKNSSAAQSAHAARPGRESGDAQGSSASAAGNA